MTEDEAYRLIQKYSRSDNPTKEDEFNFIEACNFIIETQNDDEVMIHLGGWYYEKERFHLALKYYLMAFEAGNKWASDGLGFIYYYGRTGARDYEKAFKYFSIAKEQGNIEAGMKIADMYRNGYGVEKDDAKYKEIILELYEKVKDTKDLFEVYPEVAHRLAEIYINEGDNVSARPLLIRAKDFITQRIRYNNFWGNFIVCRRVITLMYKVFEFDPDDFDFFDLFYVLATPHKVRCVYKGKSYLIESFYDEGELRVKCDGKYYKSIENFLINALFDNKHLYIIEYDCDYYNMEIIE